MYPVLSDNLTDTELAIAGMAWVDNLMLEVLKIRLLGKKDIKDKLLNYTERRRQLAYCLGIISCFCQEKSAPLFKKK